MHTAALDAEPIRLRPIAPVWHTVLLVAYFLGLALAGAAFQASSGANGHVSGPSPPHLLLYLTLLGGEWALVLYLWRGGLRRTGTPMRELIGARWGSTRSVARGIALGAGLWVAWALVSFVWDRLLGAGDAASIESFLPTRAVEYLVWTLLSLSAGFCEELLFRGYLMRQFTSWTRRPWLGIVLQAALFGISHGYQGAVACAKIALFGLVFGWMAHWRRDLQPGMIAHSITDIVGGIFRI